MLGSPKGLSDEKAARMMIALHEGRTLRTFGVKAPRLKAYFEIHPAYAIEALPLIEANNRAARFRKEWGDAMTPEEALRIIAPDWQSVVAYA